MPWREQSLMQERLEFVRACLHRRTLSIHAICRAFGISEKTGHKWLARFAAGGPEALGDRSHAPHHTPHQLSDEVRQAILRMRRKRPTWGPRKLRKELVKRDASQHWPARSTIGAFLVREGLVKRRRRTRSVQWRTLGNVRTPALAPNDVWTADFKGEFALGCGALCYPLTIVDTFSRYLLRCTALDGPRVAATRRVFERLFREHGLPRVIRSDNGRPFSQPNALGRLGQLAYWWIRLGIRPEHTRPATPADNGRHERMHRTLKAEATRPASYSLASQQQRFTRFQHEYNVERPHEALSDDTPAQHYHSSPRAYPARLPTIEYSAATATRLVDMNGVVKWRTHKLRLSRNLSGEYVGFLPLDNDAWSICYGPLILAQFVLPSAQLTPSVYWNDAFTSNE